jgi:hypothetical protein
MQGGATVKVRSFSGGRSIQGRDKMIAWAVIAQSLVFSLLNFPCLVFSLLNSLQWLALGFQSAGSHSSV